MQEDWLWRCQKGFDKTTIEVEVGVVVVVVVLVVVLGVLGGGGGGIVVVAAVETTTPTTTTTITQGLFTLLQVQLEE